MQRFLVVLVGLLLLAPLFAQAQVRVQGYTRKDGTYVQPHYRSYPDGNLYNNWSTRGNVNPYTGQPGTRDPWGSSGNLWGDRNTPNSLYGTPRSR